jgi:hypothetical protein
MPLRKAGGPSLACSCWLRLLRLGCSGGAFQVRRRMLCLARWPAVGAPGADRPSPWLGSAPRRTPESRRAFDRMLRRGSSTQDGRRRSSNDNKSVRDPWMVTFHGKPPLTFRGLHNSRRQRKLSDTTVNSPRAPSWTDASSADVASCPQLVRSRRLAGDRELVASVPCADSAHVTNLLTWSFPVRIGLELLELRCRA